MIKYDEVNRGKSGAVDKSVKKSLKSGQKVEELSKSPKNLKDLKSCKDYLFGRTFTKASIFHQFDTKNLSSC